MIFDVEYRVTTKWGDDVLIVFTTDIPRSITKRAKKNNINIVPRETSEANYCYTRTESATEAGWMVFQIEKVTVGTIAHECLHSIIEIYENMSTKLNKKTEEVFCHDLGEFVDQVFACYLKAVKKFKSRKR